MSDYVVVPDHVLAAQIVNRYSEYHSAYTSGIVSVSPYATISILLFGYMTVTVHLLALR